MDDVVLHGKLIGEVRIAIGALVEELQPITYHNNRQNGLQSLPDSNHLIPNMEKDCYMMGALIPHLHSMSLLWFL